MDDEYFIFVFVGNGVDEIVEKFIVVLVVDVNMCFYCYWNWYYIVYCFYVVGN